MVIAEVLAKDSADRSDNTFTKWILPGRTRRRYDIFNTQAPNSSLNEITINRIPVPQQIAWSGIKWKCFHPVARGRFTDCRSMVTCCRTRQENQRDRIFRRDRNYGCGSANCRLKKSTISLRASAASGSSAIPSKPCHMPSKTWSSASTPACRSLRCKRTVQLRSRSRVPVSKKVGGKPGPKSPYTGDISGFLRSWLPA